MKLLWMVSLFGLLFGLAFAVVSRMMKSLLGRALFVAGCVMTATAVFADVVSGIMGYQSFYTDIRDTGFITNPYAMKVAAVILALACYLAVAEMMRRIFRGQLRYAVFFLVGWLVIYWSTMFGFSSNQLFGRDGPKYSYVEFSNGQIALCDISLTGTPDPWTGRPLKPITPEIADKYRRQQEQERKPGQASAVQRPQASNNNTDAQHEFWVKKLHLVFDSCVRSSGNVFCSFTATNTADADIEIEWKNNSVATDSLGNTHKFGIDVGGFWPTDSFFGSNLGPADNFNSRLIPNVQTKIHAALGDISEGIGKLQNMRLHLVYVSFIDDNTYLNFTSLPIQNLYNTRQFNETSRILTADEIMARSGKARESRSNAIPTGEEIQGNIKAGGTGNLQVSAPQQNNPVSDADNKIQPWSIPIVHGKEVLRDTAREIRLKSCFQQYDMIQCYFTVSNHATVAIPFYLSNSESPNKLSGDDEYGVPPEAEDDFGRKVAATSCEFEGQEKMDDRHDGCSRFGILPGTKIVGMVSFEDKNPVRVLRTLKLRYWLDHGGGGEAVFKNIPLK